MRAMTEKNLLDAFAGESQAHVKYLVFSEMAEKEGFANVARLFKAISHAEFVHARNHLKELAGVKDSSHNLQEAIDGENFEVGEMYAAYFAVAALQDEKGAMRSTRYASEAEKIHASMYESAKAKVDGGQDISLGVVQICEICGHTVEGDAPDACPVCGVPSSKFTAF